MNQDTQTPFSPSRARRRYSAQLKSELVASCMSPGASIGATASTHSMHASVLRRWIQNHPQLGLHAPSTVPSAVNRKRADFIALDLSALQTAPRATQSNELRCQRGDTMVSVLWPLYGVAKCASFLLKVLL